MKTDKKWADLTQEEKREERFGRWLSPPDLTFSSLEAEKAYKSRVTRFIKVINLEEPDRVPVNLPTGFFPAYYAGVTLKTIMYDYAELRRAWLKFVNEFELDAFDGPGLVYPARMLEGLDYRLHSWPGRGLADNVSSYQYIEGEYMEPEEYDGFIRDPADFMLRTFLPRTVGGLAGFRKLGSVTPFIGRPSLFITQFGDPEVRASIQALLDAGLEGMRWQEAVKDISREVQRAGIPAILGPNCWAPYDLIGDMLRGTKGIMIDMYQRPAKLQEAIERITPILIDWVIGRASALACPVVFIPLHKGAGGFMSNRQFETFYWPGLKKVMMGLIEEGLVPMPFAEGDYLPRLQIIKDMPRGKVIWWFEQMDMAQAKKVLGNNACIAGNLPVSLLCTGTPKQVKDGCRKLIETCAPGGGYILTGSASMNEGNPDNLRAMTEAAKEYGSYKPRFT